MNEFLKTREQVENATKYLQRGELIESGLSCKNWEGAHVLAHLKYGDILDMGSSGGIILENLVKLKFDGRKVGIDLAYNENTVAPKGIELFSGNLMQTPFDDNSFDTVVSLSVIEHSVDIFKFAKEVSRLLKPNGNAFVSFDYWPEKLNTKGVWLYNLEWNILSKDDVLTLIREFKNNGLEVSGEIDWAIQDAVITPQFCSPVEGISYTFGILHFIKQ